ncbi:MAG: hypothetical protein RR276_02230 [Angelakisella sp.]
MLILLCIRHRHPFAINSGRLGDGIIIVTLYTAINPCTFWKRKKQKMILQEITFYETYKGSLPRMKKTIYNPMAQHSDELFLRFLLAKAAKLWYNIAIVLCTDSAKDVEAPPGCPVLALDAVTLYNSN